MVLRTTATVLLVRMTSKGRQMYIAAFIRLKPDITVIMAPVMTRGRSRSGCAISPSTKPTCYVSRCQNGSIIPSRPPLFDVSGSRLPLSPLPGAIAVARVWGLVSYRFPAAIAKHSTKCGCHKVPDELPRRFLCVPLRPPEPPGPGRRHTIGPPPRDHGEQAHENDAP